MTEAEQAQKIVQVFEELKNQKRLLACLEKKSDDVTKGLQQVIDVLRGQEHHFDHPDGTLRVAFSPIYPPEEELIALIEDKRKCRAEIARLEQYKEAFGLD
jgi:hypothetical protein